MTYDVWLASLTQDELEFVKAHPELFSKYEYEKRLELSTQGKKAFAERIIVIH